MQERADQTQEVPREQQDFFFLLNRTAKQTQGFRPTKAWSRDSMEDLNFSCYHLLLISWFFFPTPLHTKAYFSFLDWMFFPAYVFSLLPGIMTAFMLVYT